jgi:hypothetical protein
MSSRPMKKFSVLVIARLLDRECNAGRLFDCSTITGQRALSQTGTAVDRSVALSAFTIIAMLQRDTAPLLRAKPWPSPDPSPSLKVPSMSVDLMLPAAEKITLVLEGIGDDKIRVNSSNLDQPLTILPDQALESVAIAKITIRPRSCVSLLAQP